MSEQDPADCESVQFISGLAIASAEPDGALRPADDWRGCLASDRHRSNGPRDAGPTDAARLLLSYGVNDCESKLAELPLTTVWNLLRPHAGEPDVCEEAQRCEDGY